MAKQQIGVVGMAVMGRNLALNIESRGYTVSVFNRSREKTEEVIAENPGKKLVPYYTVQEATSSLMAATPSSRTPSVVIVSCLPKVLTLSVPVFPVVKRGL